MRVAEYFGRRVGSDLSINRAAAPKGLLDMGRVRGRGWMGGEAGGQEEENVAPTISTDDKQTGGQDVARHSAFGCRPSPLFFDSSCEYLVFNINIHSES